MADAGSASRRTKRARRPSEITSDADGACDARCAAFAGTATGGRPTPAEKQEAVDVVKQMKAAELLAKNARPSPNVVACAIALWRGEPFADDRSALRLFGAHPETKVRKMAWFGKLNEFAPAGFGTPGPALPAYLLERGEPSAEAVVDEQSSGDESSSGDSDKDGKDDRRQERRVDRWSASGAAQDARWQREQDAAKAQRASEAVLD